MKVVSMSGKYNKQPMRRKQSDNNLC